MHKVVPLMEMAENLPDVSIALTNKTLATTTEPFAIFFSQKEKTKSCQNIDFDIQFKMTVLSLKNGFYTATNSMYHC